MSGLELIPLITPLIGAGVGAGATVYAANKNKPVLPTPQAPVKMPDPESPQVLEERRRRIAERQTAGGRDSTLLSNDSYSNTLLGE